MLQQNLDPNISPKFRFSFLKVQAKVFNNKINNFTFNFQHGKIGRLEGRRKRELIIEFTYGGDVLKLYQ